MSFVLICDEKMHLDASRRRLQPLFKRSCVICLAKVANIKMPREPGAAKRAHMAGNAAGPNDG